MKHVVRAVVALVSLVVLAAPVAVSAQSGGDAPSVVPADQVAGSSGGDLLGDLFADDLALPADASPLGGTVNLCHGVGRHDRVLVPDGGIVDADGNVEFSCTVTAGRPVVIDSTSADCSTAEPPPFNAVTPKQQRACAKEQVMSLGITANTIAVDGGSPVDILRHKFFEVSPQRHVVYADNPVFDATPGPAQFVVAGWMAQVLGMHVGEHTIVNRVTGTGSDGSALSFLITVHLTVVARG